MALSDYKIDIVAGKNANPSQSGNSNHPNASYMCRQFNDLIDELENNNTGGNGISDLNEFTTDNLAEGTTNKYFSNTLARNAISINAGSSGVTYNNGVFNFSNLQVGANLTAFSATGYSGFTYNSNTGQFNLDPTNLKGADGDDGLSAYQIWVSQGNTGTVQDFLNSLKGSNGVSLAWRGTWDSATSYVINDAVSHNGSSYIAKIANTNKQPDTNLTDWDLWVAKGDIGNNGQSIDHLSLTSTVGRVKTYTVWGNAGKTINLGTFTVTDGADGTSLLYWSGTQSQYNALGTYDNNTLYLITG